MPEAIQMVAGFSWPRLNSAEDVRAINEAVAKGICLFSEEPPSVETRHRLRDGEAYQIVTSTGYAAVRLQKLYAATGKSVYKVGRHPKHRAAYIACCLSIGEEPRFDTYLVDIYRRRCTCPSFQSTKRVCKHQIGLAFHLNLPHRIAKSGLVLWETTCPT